MKYNLLFLLSLVFLACKPTEKSDVTKQDPEPEYPEIINKVFDAHGGLQSWNEKSALTYHVTRGERKEIQTIDLKSRKVLINGDGYDIGFNGQHAWMSPDKSNWPDARPRFYHNLIFYFHSLVFLISDPGINYNDMGIIEVDGESFHKISITYQSDVGDSPEDEYVLYINPENYRLEYILYTVTYFTGQKSKSYNALKYTSWKDVDGLLVPDEFKGFKADGDQLTDERYTASFTDIHFSFQSPDHQIFEIPELAVVDTLK